MLVCVSKGFIIDLLLLGPLCPLLLELFELVLVEWHLVVVVKLMIRGAVTQLVLVVSGVDVRLQVARRCLVLRPPNLVIGVRLIIVGWLLIRYLLDTLLLKFCIQRDTSGVWVWLGVSHDHDATCSLCSH